MPIWLIELEIDWIIISFIVYNEVLDLVNECMILHVEHKTLQMPKNNRFIYKMVSTGIALV